MKRTGNYSLKILLDKEGLLRKNLNLTSAPVKHQFRPLGERRLKHYMH